MPKASVVAEHAEEEQVQTSSAHSLSASQMAPVAVAPSTVEDQTRQQEESKEFLSATKKDSEEASKVDGN